MTEPCRMGHLCMYTLCPSKAVQGNETKVCDHVSLFKITLVYFLSLFKWHNPYPGQQLSVRVLSFGALYSPIGGIYTFALHYISSKQPSGNSFNAMLRVCPLIDVGDITCHFPPLTDQQHLRLPYEMTVPNHLLGYNNEVRSLSCTGSGVYCWMHVTPMNSLKIAYEI